MDVDTIRRKLIHIKARPTYETINNLSLLLKNLGYQNIPKLSVRESYISKNDIDSFCNQIEYIITNEQSDPKGIRRNHLSKEIFMFRESSLLPKNVYVSEKDNEEKLEDNYMEDDICSEKSSSNISENSEIEEVQEEGYTFYDEVSEDSFSE